MNSPENNSQLSRKARAFQQREQEILDTALHCFCCDQWESVTVAQIAGEVGIAKGTMYLHFDSKHEIYARLSLNFYHALLSHLSEHLQSHSNAIDDFRQLVKLAFEFHLQRPIYRRVTQYCEREDFKCSIKPEIADSFDQIERRIEQIISGIITRGSKQGVFKSPPTEEVLLGLKCTFHGALTRFWCDRNGEQSQPVKFVDTVTDYMLASIVCEPSVSTATDKKSKLTTTIKKRQIVEESLELNHE